jgi:hypothetical protein
MEEPQIYSRGASGTRYGYWIHRIGTAFVVEPGNYIFAGETSPNQWSPVYIGQTESLRNRLANHDKDGCTRRNGATHLHVHTTPGGAQTRLTEEADLLASWRTPCNVRS